MTENIGSTPSFYDRPSVRVDYIPVGPGVPLGIERVSHPELGIGGVYGTWGESYDNATLPRLLEEHLDEPLGDGAIMNLAELGFLYRQHTPQLTEQEHIDLEVEVGARLLRGAAEACGWDPGEVEGVLIGMSAPVVPDYTERIARAAGIPDSALKVSMHKACDGSVGALHLALNPEVSKQANLQLNIAGRLYGKKVLVGGIEGLSRFLRLSHDRNALQLFGNGAGVIGVIPGQTMKFLVGKTFEAFDDEGMLEVQVLYPHTRQMAPGRSLVEVYQEGDNHFRFSGLMHEPEGGEPVVMAGLMGMVKLFVRNGVQVVRDVYHAYQQHLEGLGQSGRQLTVAVVHHANYKINALLEKSLQKEGIHVPMPWLLSDFGNVSAASNMIAFLRKLPGLKPGDHILIDGFGAGTYYDAMALELGGV